MCEIWSAVTIDYSCFTILSVYIGNVVCNIQSMI